MERSRSQQIKAGLERAAEIKRQRQDLQLPDTARVKPPKKKHIDVVHVIPAQEAEESIDIAAKNYEDYREREEMIN